MDEFSKQKTDEFKINVLDNGAFYKSKALVVPENMALIFLPQYSTELNPAELSEANHEPKNKHLRIKYVGNL